MVIQMVQLLVLIGLLVIILDMLITSSRESSANDPQQECVVKRLALAVLVVGAFSMSTWLIG